MSANASYSEFEIVSISEGIEPGDTLDVENMSTGKNQLFVLKSYDSEGVYLIDKTGKTSIFNPNTLVSMDRSRNLVITGLSKKTLKLRKF